MKQELMGCQWHQLDHMQIICTLLQTDNHTSTSLLNFTGQMLFLTPNQQCQSTEGKDIYIPEKLVEKLVNTSYEVSWVS